MMKAIKYIIGAGAVIAALASCAKEIAVEEPVVPEAKMIEVTLKASQNLTKTSMAGNGDILWSEGDKIAVTYSTGTYTFTLVGEGGNTTASFKGYILEGSGDPVSATYPVAEVVPGDAQTYLDGTFADDTLPMTATYNAGTLTFTATAAVVMTPAVPASFAGDVTLSYTVGEVTYAPTMAVTAGENPKNLIFVVVPGAKDFTMSFGPTDVKCIASAATAAGSRYKLTATEIIITTPAELVAFSSYVNAGNNMKGQTVKLGADIDMTGINFTPIGTSTNLFKGYFDGQNYTISNLTVNVTTLHAGLFGNIKDENAKKTAPVVKDLIIDGASITATGNYVGVVAGQAYTTAIENVTVKNSTVNAESSAYVGGITGGTYVSIKGCKVLDSEITGKDQVGGLVGYIVGASIENCEATGITVEAKEERAGGLAGKMQIGDTSFQKFNNNTVSGSAKAPDMAGGLFGQIMGGKNTYEVMDNTIDVTLNAPKTSPIGVLRSGQNVEFTGAISQNIRCNWWTDATLAQDAYTYTAAETNGAGDQVVTRAVAVAQIGDKSYATLAEAIAAVPTDGTATTIKMAEDVELAAALTVAAGKNITLDLNGKTIKNDASKSLAQLITINGQLTVDDSSDDHSGKIQNTASGKYVVKTGTSAVLTLKDGIIETTAGNSNGAVYGTSGSFVMTGGKIIAAGTGVTSKNVNISGGEITATAGQALCAAGTISGGKFTSANNNAVYANQSGTLQITGGEFTGISTKPTINLYNTDVKVTGATLANGVGFASNATAMLLLGTDEPYLASTHAAFCDGETVVGYAPINTGLFASSKVSGKTVKLTKDVATTANLNVTKSFTLDLNGNNITCTPAKADAAIFTKGTASAPVVLTIKGEGKVSCGDHGEGCNAVQVGNYSTVNIKGGEFEVPTDNSTIYMLATAGSSVVNISGGEFKSGDGKYVLNIKDDVRTYNTFNVTGGTFYGFNPADNIAEGENTNFCPDGYTATETSTGVWTVQEATSIDTVDDLIEDIPNTAIEYSSTSTPVISQEELNNAISNASAGSTVKITKAGTYKVPALSKNVCIEGVAGVEFDCVGSGSIASIPDGCKFKNVEMKMGTNDYHGFQHAGTIVMEGCTINGKFFSYGDMVFKDCIFNQTASDYCMWAYAGNIVYENCTIKCNGKFVNVYNEGNGTWKVGAKGCTFNSTKANKAALNIKESCCNGEELHFNVVIEDCTTAGLWPSASGDDNSALFVGGPLWQVDDRTASTIANSKNGVGVKVTLDGSVVYGN